MMGLQPINKICPVCGNGNYMRSLESVCKKDDKLRIKCINCNSYFTVEEIYGNKGEKIEMDAVEYLKERQRMLQSGTTDYKAADFVNLESTGKEEEAVRIVYWWGKRNPVKTNKKKFVEVFGVEPQVWHLDKNGFEVLVPEKTDWWKDSWWNETYKEPKK